MATAASLSVIEFMLRLDAASTTNDMWQELKKLAHAHGYKFACFGDLPTPKQRMDDVVFESNFPADWRKHYYDQDYIRWDPAASYLRRATSPYALSDIVRSDMYGPKHMRIVDEAREFRLKSMFLIPLRNTVNEPAFLSLADSQIHEPSANSRVDLHLAAFYFNMRIRPLLTGAVAPNLTDRERECLQWVARGKSDQDIADILKISAKTVNFHIEAVKRKFDVASRTVAAAMAVKVGIIQV